jgi:hypothetical protein
VREFKRPPAFPSCPERIDPTHFLTQEKQAWWRKAM